VAGTFAGRKETSENTPPPPDDKHNINVTQIIGLSDNFYKVLAYITNFERAVDKRIFRFKTTRMSYIYHRYMSRICCKYVTCA